MKKGENMKKFFCVLCGICLFYMGYAQEKEVKAVIETNLGNMIVKLYNDTPTTGTISSVWPKPDTMTAVCFIV